VLSASECTSLDKQGFAVFPRALSLACVARLRVAFENPGGHGTQHVEISESTPELATWREVTQHPTLLAAAHYILARPFRVRESHGRNPLPGFGQQGLHADWMPRSPGEPFYVVTSILMLDDFTAENGATRVVPGSHLSLQPPPKPMAQPSAHHRDETIVTGSAGSLLVFNGHLWHSGRRNDSQGPRRAVQTVIIAEDASLPGDS
jgi:ectoine hydroxylase-related dioxygenase (phytanoyl-CoA dioxygenase family)